MPAWKRAKRPHDQQRHQRQIEPAGDAVREFDDGGGARECCVTVALHNGQWLPQPAPEPVARTNAPHNTTPRL